MWDIASSPARAVTQLGWLVFATVDVALMWALPGLETIPYHLVWASFALLYGLFPWSFRVSALAFTGVTVATGIPLIEHARWGIIGWEECSEIVLMGVIAALLMWHVRRNFVTQQELRNVNESERIRSHYREIATRFGSHEIRTRLAIARSVTEMIRDSAGIDGAHLSDQTHEDADLVLTELDKATALSSKLLAFVRLGGESGEQPIDLEELLASITRRWVFAADREWSYASFPGLVLGDPERVEVLLDCLLENAVKFTEPGDRISVDARRTDDHILIAVEDGGRGIPATDIERVTRLFETGSTAGDQAGSGLGLGMVRAMMESRGGRVQVSSIEGQGTTVILGIPYRRGADPRPALRMSSAPAVAHIDTSLADPVAVAAGG